MNNQKKNVHKSGNVASLLDDPDLQTLFNNSNTSTESTSQSQQFITEQGVEFTPNELAKINANKITPWKYANRHHDDFGDLDSLIKSIKNDGQQQPIIVRLNDNIESSYELIFGRRRYEACKRLGIEVIAVVKHDLSDLEALRLQHVENELRQDVSNYSNALLYKQLLDDKKYTSISELSRAFDISRSSLYDILSFNELPEQLVNLIPNIHSLSVILVKEIVKLLKDDSNHDAIISIASSIGTSINSIPKLRHAVTNFKFPQIAKNIKTEIIKAEKTNQTLFTVRLDSKGNLVFRIDSSVTNDDKIKMAKDALREILMH